MSANAALQRPLTTAGNFAGLCLQHAGAGPSNLHRPVWTKLSTSSVTAFAGGGRDFQGVPARPRTPSKAALAEVSSAEPWGSAPATPTSSTRPYITATGAEVYTNDLDRSDSHWKVRTLHSFSLCFMPEPCSIAWICHLMHLMTGAAPIGTSMRLTSTTRVCM